MLASEMDLLAIEAIYQIALNYIVKQQVVNE